VSLLNLNYHCATVFEIRQPAARKVEAGRKSQLADSEKRSRGFSGLQHRGQASGVATSPSYATPISFSLHLRFSCARPLRMYLSFGLCVFHFDVHCLSAN